jgi:hypothetical protein
MYGYEKVKIFKGNEVCKTAKNTLLLKVFRDEYSNVFWVMTLCSVVGKYLCSSEMMVFVYETT